MPIPTDFDIVAPLSLVF